MVAVGTDAGRGIDEVNGGHNGVEVNEKPEFVGDVTSMGVVGTSCEAV
jgi:hypothetical protein